MTSSKKVTRHLPIRSLPRWRRIYRYQIVQGPSADQHFPPALIGSSWVCCGLLIPQARMRRANNFIRSKARCLASPTWKLPHCRRCYIGQVCPVRKGCRSTTVWIPSWLSSSRACCGIRQQSHQAEDHAAIPDQPVKLDRYVERAAFQFHPVCGRLRPEVSVKDCAPSPLYGCCFMRALPRNDGPCTRKMDEGDRGCVGTHVPQTTRTARLWQSYHTTCGRLSGKQELLGIRVFTTVTRTWCIHTRTSTANFA